MQHTDGPARQFPQRLPQGSTSASQAETKTEPRGTSYSSLPVKKPLTEWTIEDFTSLKAQTKHEELELKQVEEWTRRLIEFHHKDNQHQLMIIKFLRYSALLYGMDRSGFCWDSQFDATLWKRLIGFLMSPEIMSKPSLMDFSVLVIYEIYKNVIYMRTKEDWTCDDQDYGTLNKILEREWYKSDNSRIRKYAWRMIGKKVSRSLDASLAKDLVCILRKERPFNWKIDLEDKVAKRHAKSTQLEVFYVMSKLVECMTEESDKIWIKKQIIECEALKSTRGGVREQAFFAIMYAADLGLVDKVDLNTIYEDLVAGLNSKGKIWQCTVCIVYKLYEQGLIVSAQCEAIEKKLSETILSLNSWGNTITAYWKFREAWGDATEDKKQFVKHALRNGKWGLLQFVPDAIPRYGEGFY